MWEKDKDADYLVANQPLLALEGMLCVCGFKKQTIPNSLKKVKEAVENGCLCHLMQTIKSLGMRLK